MSEIHADNRFECTLLAQGGTDARRRAVTRHLTGGLRLAAAPTFAVMALLAGLPGDDPADVLCLTADHTPPFSGMVLMYLLMSAFHLPPWLTLLFSRQQESGYAATAST